MLRWRKILKTPFGQRQASLGLKKAKQRNQKWFQFRSDIWRGNSRWKICCWRNAYGENITDKAIVDCVNFASRLEHLTKEKECPLVITSDLSQRPGLSIQAWFEKNVTVKGKSEAFKISVSKDSSALPV